MACRVCDLVFMIDFIVKDVALYWNICFLLRTVILVRLPALLWGKEVACELGEKLELREGHWRTESITVLWQILGWFFVLFKSVCPFRTRNSKGRQDQFITNGSSVMNHSLSSSFGSFYIHVSGSCIHDCNVQCHTTLKQFYISCHDPYFWNSLNCRLTTCNLHSNFRSNQNCYLNT